MSSFGGGAKRQRDALSDEDSLDEEMQEDINKVLEPLAACGIINIEDFTANALIGMFWLPRTFLKEIRVFKSCPSSELLDKIVSAANREGVIISVRGLSVKETVALARWLRSARGRMEMEIAQKEVKLSKRAAKAGLAVESMAYVQALNVQMSDFSRKKKDTRSRYEQRIVELRRMVAYLEAAGEEGDLLREEIDEIERLEGERDSQLEAIATEYLPGSGYMPIGSEDLKSRCYEVYLREAPAKGQGVLAEYNTAIKLAVEQCGDKILDGHMNAYFRSDQVKESLKAFLKEKITWCVDNYDKKAERKFRALLAATGGQEVAPATAGPAFEGDAEQRWEAGKKSFDGVHAAKVAAGGQAGRSEIKVEQPWKGEQKPYDEIHADKVIATEEHTGRRESEVRTMQEARTERRCGKRPAIQIPTRDAYWLRPRKGASTPHR